MAQGKAKITKEDREWAKKVKERDKACCICGVTERLSAHHIIPRENKDMKYCLLNGIALCPLHHKFSRTISAHNNSFAFYLWLHTHRPNQFNYLMEYCDHEA